MSRNLGARSSLSQRTPQPQAGGCSQRPRPLCRPFRLRCWQVWFAGCASRAEAIRKGTCVEAQTCKTMLWIVIMMWKEEQLCSAALHRPLSVRARHRRKYCHCQDRLEWGERSIQGGVEGFSRGSSFLLPPTHSLRRIPSCVRAPSCRGGTLLTLHTAELSPAPSPGARQKVPRATVATKLVRLPSPLPLQQAPCPAHRFVSSAALSEEKQGVICESNTVKEPVCNHLLGVST